MTTDNPIPSEVGETTEINGHRVTLEDPPGAIGKKLHCENCGMWVVSAIHFDRESCEADDTTDTEVNTE